VLAPKPTGGSTSVAALERLYRRHVAEVYRYAVAMSPTAAAAEDVVQTTFLNAFRSLERGQSPQRPLNWLMTIAHNVCRQRYRQQARRPTEVAFDEDLVAAPEEAEGVNAEDIRRALAHLGFNRRTALVMRELEGCSYAEIAERLGLTHSAVETLIFRARRALREQLEASLTCSEAARAISRQLDGMLPRAERGQLRAHLRSCPECDALARRMRGQRAAIKSLGALPLPATLTSLTIGDGCVALGFGARSHSSSPARPRRSSSRRRRPGACRPADSPARCTAGRPIRGRAAARTPRIPPPPGRRRARPAARAPGATAAARTAGRRRRRRPTR
jgi:RNA polymerase sigma-70 factor, ECF subfamily